MVGNLHDDLSICLEKVTIDGLFEALGGPCNALLFKLDLASSALIVLGTNIAIEYSQSKNHVVERWNVELKIFVPDWIQVAMLNG